MSTPRVGVVRRPHQVDYQSDELEPFDRLVIALWTQVARDLIVGHVPTWVWLASGDYVWCVEVTLPDMDPALLRDRLVRAYWRPDDNSDANAPVAMGNDRGTC